MNNGEGPGTLIDTVNYLYCEEYNAGVASTRNGDWVCGIDFAEYGGLTVKNLYAIGCIADGAWESCYHTEESPTKINFQIIDCVAKNGGKKPTALYGAGFLWCFERAGETFYLENCSGSNNKLGDLRLLNDAGSAFIDYTPIPALVNQGITP